MKAALHKYAGPAKFDRFVDPLRDLFDRMNIRVRFSGTAVKGAKCAHNVADVCVVDIAVDDVSNHVLRIFAQTDFIGRETDADKIIGFEQGRTIVRIYSPAIENPVEY